MFSKKFDAGSHDGGPLQQENFSLVRLALASLHIIAGAKQLNLIEPNGC